MAALHLSPAGDIAVGWLSLRARRHLGRPRYGGHVVGRRLMTKCDVSASSYPVGSGLATIGDRRSLGCVIVFSLNRGRPSLISNHGSFELTH